MAELKVLEKTKDDDLFRVLTHELKSPLTPIQMYLSLLLSEKIGKLNREQKEGLNIISRKVNRLNYLILDVLMLSKLERQKIKFNFEDLDITDLLEKIIKDVSWQADEKNIELRVHFSSLPLLEGDRERLNQVFYNLIENAIKFTPQKGRIDLFAEKKGYSFIITVKDTGIGIPISKLPKIFDKFYQVDNSLTREHQGSGLGLTICRGIVKAHGGDINVKSTPKKGTTFEVVLPYKKIGKPTEAFGEIVGAKKK